MENTETFNESFLSTIEESKLPDAIIDLSEIAIDNVLDNLPEIIKEIPFIGTIANAISGVFAIRDYIFTTKILAFLKPIYEINPEQRKKMLRKLQFNEKYYGKIGNKLILLIDKLDDTQKSYIVGILFKKMLEGKIDYSSFLRYASIIDKIFLRDLKELPLYREPLGNRAITPSLYSLGLTIRVSGFNNTGDTEQDEHKLSRIGIELCELLEGDWL